MGNPHKTIIYTDHKPLVGLFNKKEPTNARQTRWCMAANLLGVEICYESGKKNVITDALSRMKNDTDKKVLVTKITKEVDESLLSKVVKEFIE